MQGLITRQGSEWLLAQPYSLLTNIIAGEGMQSWKKLVSILAVLMLAVGGCGSEDDNGDEQNANGNGNGSVTVENGETVLPFSERTVESEDGMARLHIEQGTFDDTTSVLIEKESTPVDDDYYTNVYSVAFENEPQQLVTLEIDLIESAGGEEVTLAGYHGGEPIPVAGSYVEGGGDMIVVETKDFSEHYLGWSSPLELEVSNLPPAEVESQGDEFTVEFECPGDNCHFECALGQKEDIGVPSDDDLEACDDGFPIDPGYMLTGDWKFTVIANGSDGTTNQKTVVFEIKPEGEAPEAEVLWEKELSGNVATPAVDDGGYIYAGGSGRIYKVDPDDGEAVWTNEEPEGQVFGIAIDDDGILYVGSSEGSVYAIDSVDNSLEWRFDEPEDGVETTPAIGSDGTIYVGSQDGHLYAIDEDGDDYWTFETDNGHPIYSSPSIGEDGTIYFGSAQGSLSGNLYAVDPDTEEEQWSFSSAWPFIGSPAIGADGTIYAGPAQTGGSAVYAIDPDSGDAKWEVETGNIEAGAIIADDGVVYVPSFAGVHAIDPDAEEELWSATSADAAETTPVLADDGTIYFGGGPYFRAVDTDDGEEVWSVRIGRTASSMTGHPVVDDGVVYVGTSAQTLVAINADDGETSADGLDAGPWPAYGHDRQRTSSIEQ